MTLLEKNELGLIAVTVLLIGFVSPLLPTRLSLGYLILILSSVVFLQSLVRDLFLLRLQRKNAGQIQPKTAQCMCLESTVGVVGLFLALALLGVGQPTFIALRPFYWPGLVLLVMTLGFLSKDLVLEWNPWRIRRERDHMNVIFQWRAKKS